MQKLHSITRKIVNNACQPKQGATGDYQTTQHVTTWHLIILFRLSVSPHISLDYNIIVPFQYNDINGEKSNSLYLGSPKHDLLAISLRMGSLQFRLGPITCSLQFRL